MAGLRGTLVLLGAGKMGGALLEGWLKAGITPSQITVIDPGPPPEVMATIQGNRIAHNPDLDSIRDVEVVVAAVKPQVMDQVLSSVAQLGQQRPLILSVAAGKTIATFEKHFGNDSAVIRTIPNTPAAIGRGITAMSANRNVTTAQMALARQLLAATGEVVEVDDEAMIDAVTAVSGSGPAYVFLLAECLAAAGEKVGLPRDLSVKLARATVAGSGELMRQSGIDAETLRKNVTSPNGTTYAALQILMGENGMQQLFDQAIDAATRRGRELAG